MTSIQEVKKLVSTIAKACKACQSDDPSLAIKSAMSPGVKKYIKTAGLTPVTWAQNEAAKAKRQAEELLSSVLSTVFPRWAELGVDTRFDLYARCHDNEEQAAGLRSLNAAKAVLKACDVIQAVLGTGEVAEASSDA